MSDEDVQALVVDNGSGMCKVIRKKHSHFLSYTLPPFRLGLPVMMLLEQSFLPLLVVPDMLESWSVWVKKMLMSVMKHN
jgi:hypothetical protein